MSFPRCHKEILRDLLLCDLWSINGIETVRLLNMSQEEHEMTTLTVLTNTNPIH